MGVCLVIMTDNHGSFGYASPQDFGVDPFPLGCYFHLLCDNPLACCFKLGHAYTPLLRDNG